MKQKRRTIKRRRIKKRSFKLKVSGGNQNTIVVFNLTDTAGFYSTFWFLCKAYIYAKENNYPFFIETTTWQYSYDKGWHDYFTSLNKFEDKGQYKNTTIKRYSHTSIDGVPDYALQKYVDIIPEIYILQQSIQDRINKYKQDFGNYSSLYIRRGDKKTEMTLLSTDDILSKTTIKDDGSNIFVQTDDFTVIDEVKKSLPSCNILSIVRSSLTGSHDHELKSTPIANRKENTEELFISVGIFLGGINCWTNYKSNLGVFHKLSESNKVKLYSPENEAESIINDIFILNNICAPYNISEGACRQYLDKASVPLYYSLSRYEIQAKKSK